MIKIQIKSIFGKVIFECEKENNTIKETLLEAIKSGADLSGADLSGANLSGANLSGADLSGANLSCANLSCANLSGAYLSGAYLSGANLSDANLSDANLYGANLYGAYLYGANLSDADLSGADLSKEEQNKIKYLWQIIPEEGDFIAWKKTTSKHIIKLLIPANAKRTCNIKNRKCRAEFAKVLNIFDKGNNEIEQSISQYQNVQCVYKKGEMVYPDSYDDNFMEDCSHGIHFFVTRKEAENW